MPKKPARERRARKPSPSASELAERRLVDAALKKLRSGQTPSSQERVALKRFEKQQEEERRWQYLRTTSKRLYMAISGRSARVIIDQARLHGLPYPIGPRESVDLTAVVRWLHDFLADNAQRLKGPETDDPLLAGASSPALERYRLARAQREELELAARRGELLDVDELLTWYEAEVAAPIRRSLEALKKHHGQAAADVVLRGLEAAEQSVTRRLKQP